MARASRGQISHVFPVLFAIIVIIATLFLGGKLVMTLLDTGCEAGKVGLRDDLSAAFDIGAVFGSARTERIRPSCDATMLCFVDAESIGADQFTTDDSVIKASVEGNVQENIFLTSDDGTIPVGYDKRISLRERGDTDIPFEPLCIEAGADGFVFRTEGQGRTVRVLEAETLS